MDERENGEQGWAYCVIHDRVEEDRSNDFAVCIECGHVYRTEGQLRRSFDKNIVGNPWWKRIIKPTSFKIYVCPLCGHDF